MTVMVKISLYCQCGASLMAMLPKDKAEAAARHVQRVQERFRRIHSLPGHRLIHRSEWERIKQQETTLADEFRHDTIKQERTDP